MSGYLSIVEAVDGLYRGVVTDPTAWTDRAIEDWAADTIGGGSRPSRSLARELRRCMRAAVKMRDFWLDPPAGVPSDAGDWRTRVDVSLGIRAWRPPLEIAREGLETEGTQELYEEMTRRFREVHGDEWMDGLTFEDWSSGGNGS